MFIDENPQTVDIFDLIPIKPGVNYEVAIDVTRRGVSSKCNKTESYDQDTCFNDCYKKHPIDNCFSSLDQNQSIGEVLKRLNCTIFMYKEISNETEQTNETNNKYENFTQVQHKIEECFNDCQPRCDSYNYHLSIYSTSKRPAIQQD